MRMVVRAFALMLLLATVGIWFGLGGSTSWTKASAPSVSATGAGVRQAVWTPGIEFLALGVSGSIIIFAATLFVRLTPKD